MSNHMILTILTGSLLILAALWLAWIAPSLYRAVRR